MGITGGLLFVAAFAALVGVAIWLSKHGSVTNTKDEGHPIEDQAPLGNEPQSTSDILAAGRAKAQKKKRDSSQTVHRRYEDDDDGLDIVDVAVAGAILHDALTEDEEPQLAQQEEASAPEPEPEKPVAETEFSPSWEDDAARNAPSTPSYDTGSYDSGGSSSYDSGGSSFDSGGGGFDD